MNFPDMLKSSSREVHFVNSLSNITNKDLDDNKQRLYQQYKDDDVYNTTPSCSCGKTVRRNLEGTKCKFCDTFVLPVVGKKLEPQLWMRTPNGVAHFINPLVWIMLGEYFTVNKFNVIAWICTTDMVSKKGEAIQAAIQAVGIERGYNNFVHNFDDILNKLFALREFRSAKKQKRDDIIYVLNRYKDCIFTPYLPVINRNLLVVEDFAIGKYKDPTIAVAINAAEMLLGIDRPSCTLKQSARENRTAKMLNDISRFYELYFKDNIASKTGLARKHLCSSRVNYSARTVITSITDEHHYEDIYMPWSASVGLLRTHLQNKLHRMDMKPNEVFGFLNASVYRYHPLVDHIFKELIDESPQKALIGTWCRNPSLARASMGAVRIPKIKTDVSDPTTSMSILCTAGWNA